MNGRMVKRGLRLSHEDAGGDVQRFRAAHAHHLLHPDRHALHDPLHDAEVIKDGEERGDEDDDRQHLEGENHAERSAALAQRVAEDERRAGFGVARAWRSRPRRSIGRPCRNWSSAPAAQTRAAGPFPTAMMRSLIARLCVEHNHAIPRMTTRPSSPVKRPISDADDLEDQVPLVRLLSGDAEGVLDHLGALRPRGLPWCSTDGTTPNRHPLSRRS